MDNRDVLERSIKKAIDGGWNAKLNEDLDYWEPNHHAWFDGGRGERGEHVYPEDVWAELIFNHDFARALWGEEMFRWQSIQSGAYYDIKDSYIEGGLPLYMYHLMMMVIADDPLEYLGENL